ncbi:MAG: His/Gly/Thr/Pro-type tRNA ligase C-terminal domain-containing protein, partial [bacterium]|nr:His/Gly/Thr/Pro-type tRNA ligase C-terminal domain-containing protein [bacterium]
TIYLSREKNIAVNKEVLEDEVLKELNLNRDELEEAKAIEVGNIFSLGTKFSEPFDVSVTNESGESITPIMGCYGIGLGRAMGTVAEVLSDENGLIWPREIAPFDVHIVLVSSNPELKNLADEIYKTFRAEGLEALYDDRDVRAGEKFADADLIGIPTRVIIGEKALGSKMLEVKDRATGEVKEMTIESLVASLKS